MKKFVILLLFLVYAGMASAQSLVITTRDGSEQTRILATVQSLKFSGSNLMIKSSDGSIVNRPLSEIRKIVFKPGDTSTGDLVLSQKVPVRIFPNPVGDFLHLENLPEGNPVVSVYRPDGALILQTRVSPGNNIIQTGHLNRGIYILRVSDQVVKFIKL